MAWTALAAAGLSAIGGISKGITAEGQARATNIINEAQTWASNLMRGANNELAAKRGSLRRYTQSVNNQRIMEQGGRMAEASLVNYRRRRDAALDADLETQISLAEQAGAQEAAAGASGLTGGVADTVAATTALRASRMRGRFEQSMKQGDWDASRQQGEILRASLESLDQSQIIDDIDYSRDVYTPQESPFNWFSIAAEAAATGLKAYAGKVPAAKTKYGTTPGSQQSRMLAEQDSWFN